jgi:protein O-GlcNAc transferase
MVQFESVINRLKACFVEQDFKEAKRIVFKECVVDGMTEDHLRNLTSMIDHLSDNKHLTLEDFIELYSDRNFRLLTSLKNCKSSFIIKNPDILNIIGASFTALNSFNSALEIFQDILEVTPSHEEALNNLGVIYLEKKNFPKAETYFLKLLELNPTHHDCLFNLANSYYFRNRYESAIHYYKILHELKPDSVNTIRQLCLIFLTEEKYSHAIIWLKRYLQHKPYDSSMIAEVGNCHLMQGDTKKAQDNFQRSLEIDPRNLETLTSYGISFLKSNDYLQAIKIFDQVIELDNLRENAFFNKALAQFDLNLLDDAITSLRFCLKINKNNVEAKKLLIEVETVYETKRASEVAIDLLETNDGGALSLIHYSEQLEKERKVEDAINERLKVVKLTPYDATNLFNLGRLYQDLEKYEKAIKFYKSALEVESRLSGAVYNMAICFRSLFNFQAAAECYQKALKLEPENVDFINNLALLYGDIGDIEKSLETFRRGLRVDKNNSAILFNMTTPLLALKEISEAQNILLKLTERTDLQDSHLSNIYNSLGNVYLEQTYRSEAIKAYRKALQLAPDSQEAAHNLIYNVAHACDWDSLKKLEKEIKSVGITKGAFSPFGSWQFTPDPEVQLKRALRYTNSKHKVVGCDQAPVFQTHGKKIKLGLFSADFRQHPVSYLIIRLLELIDRDFFEVIAYSSSMEHENYMRNAVINAVDKFRNIQLINDDELLELVHNDSIDIAVDLTGFTDNERFLPFVRRLAPIQINFLGYPGTVANECMDYIIADEIVIPEEFKQYYTEHKIFMPHSYMPTDNLREFEKENISREKFGLPEDAFVICCFNNNYKIGPREFDCWCGILKKFPSTVLWLKSSNDLSEQNLRKEGIKRGIDPSRIIFAGFVETDAIHLGRQQLADIFVDTFNFNAHTTASEALWCGVPVISMIGKTFCSRVSSSLLNAVGLDDLITQSPEDYEALICKLIEDKDKLDFIKKRLKNNIKSHPLFDSEKYAKNFETAMKLVFKRHQNKEQLSDLYIN